MSSQNFVRYLEKVINDFENEKINQKTKDRSLGVIYTPKLIVDHIVSNIFRLYFEEVFKFPKIYNINSLLKILQQRLSKNHNLKIYYIKKLKKLKILDPACGSGRFLSSIAKILYQIYKIINPELDDFQIKRTIVQENLYGIEIDKTAYFMTKLRFISWIFSKNKFNYRIPDLKLKNGNFEEINQIINQIDLKINLYNLDFLLKFESEKFDIIVGNPPYVENKKIKNIYFKKDLKKRFKSAYRLFDLSIVFIERALELLKEKQGYLSMITINKYLSADYGIYIRELLVNNTEIIEISNVSSLPIFGKTAVYPIIITLKKSHHNLNNTILIKTYENLNELNQYNDVKSQILPQELMRIVPAFVFPIFGRIDLINYLFSNFKSFAEVIKDFKITYRPYGFINWSKHLDKIDNKVSSQRDLLLIGTGNVGKYHVKFDKPIKIAKKTLSISYFKYQNEFEFIWKILKDQKLIFREIAKELTWIYDPGIYTNVTGLYFLNIPSFSQNKLFSLLAIMNSKLMDRIFKTLFSSLHMAGGYLRYNGSFIKKLPLPQRLPLSLSICGKCTQILSQLYYDFSSNHISEMSKLNLIKERFQQKITHSLQFFKKLSNSLVRLLYLDELYLEHNMDYNSMRNLLYSKVDLNKIHFKYLLPRYQIHKYDTYTLEELKLTLDSIKNFSNIITTNEVLLNQMNQILNNDLS
ncbi:MAG: Eco57I restriction-modification methylase domain-containing protein [Promethearchaeota archaeon]